MRILRCVFIIFILAFALIFPPSVLASGMFVPSVPAYTLLSHMLLVISVTGYAISAGLHWVVLFYKQDNIRRVLPIFYIAVILINVSAFLLRWYETYQHGWGHFPLTDFYECLLVLCLMLAFCMMCIDLKIKSELVRALFLSIIVIVLVYAMNTQFTGLHDLFNRRDFMESALGKVALSFKVLSLKHLFLATALCFLIMSAIVSATLLATKRFTKLASVTEINEQALYTWNRKGVLSGIIILVPTILLGLFWSKLWWGQYWTHMPQEVFLTVTLITYLLFAWTSSAKGWCKTQVLKRSIYGVCIIPVAYFVSEFLFRGI